MYTHITVEKTESRPIQYSHPESLIALFLFPFYIFSQGEDVGALLIFRSLFLR